jgi:uncharacterized protein (TIGR04255 family)
MTVKFRNPPIHELRIGVYFSREIEALHAEHIALFWSIRRSEFPTIKQEPLVTLPLPLPLLQRSLVVGFPAPGEIFPSPRFRLESADGGTVVQIQRNAFLFNWRKRGDRYPHFDVVKKSFDRNIGLFDEFLKKELSTSIPQIQFTELNYINLIEQNEYWQGPPDTKRILPRFRLPVDETTALGPVDFNLTAIQRLSQDVSVTIGVRSGGRSTPTGVKPALVFEFRAIGSLGTATKVEADAWFEKAHETVGECFVTTTSPEIQAQYWEPITDDR